MGYVYVMTNESYFDNLIKIGYSEDVIKRAKQLYTTGVPTHFEIYCTYETEMKNADRIFRDIFREFRVNDKREFFELTPEEVYKELSLIAELTGTTDKLHLFKKKETEQEESIQQASEALHYNSCSDDAPFFNDLLPRGFGPLNKTPFIRGRNFCIYKSDYKFYELNPYLIRYKDKWYILNAGYADSSAHNIATHIFYRAYQLYANKGFSENKVQFKIDSNIDGALYSEIMTELYSWGQSLAYDEEPIKEIPEYDLVKYIQTVQIRKNDKMIEISFRIDSLKILQDSKEMIEYVIQHDLKES